MKHELLKRLLSALVLIPSVVGLVLYGGWLMDLLVLLVGALMLREWSLLTQAGRVEASLIWLLMPVWITAATGYSLVALVMLAVALPVMLLLWQQKRAHGWLALGMIYLSLGILPLLDMMEREATPWLLMWLLLLVWATDIGGYAFGKSFKGPKLAPSISPNKTWAGALGAVLLSLLVGWAVSQGFWPENGVTILLLSAAISMASQVGDLAESKVKRLFGVKDSGHIIPGHGGLLDRLDGLMFAAPAMWGMAWLVGAFGWDIPQ